MAKKTTAVKTKHFTQRTRLSEDINNRLIKHCEDDRRSISSVIAMAVENYLNASKKESA